MTLDEVEPEVWIQSRYPSQMHEAFIKPILAHPRDEERRLVFADWLDEHGEEDYAQELRRGPMAIWKTALGEQIPIRHLSDLHLLRILHLNMQHLRPELLRERRRRGLPSARPHQLERTCGEQDDWLWRSVEYHKFQ